VTSSLARGAPAFLEQYNLFNSKSRRIAQYVQFLLSYKSAPDGNPSLLSRKLLNRSRSRIVPRPARRQRYVAMLIETAVLATAGSGQAHRATNTLWLRVYRAMHTYGLRDFAGPSRSWPQRQRYDQPTVARSKSAMVRRCFSFRRQMRTATRLASARAQRRTALN